MTSLENERETSRVDVNEPDGLGDADCERVSSPVSVGRLTVSKNDAERDAEDSELSVAERVAVRDDVPLTDALRSAVTDAEVDADTVTDSEALRVAVGSRDGEPVNVTTGVTEPVSVLVRVGGSSCVSVSEPDAVKDSESDGVVLRVSSADTVTVGVIDDETDIESLALRVAEAAAVTLSLALNDPVAVVVREPGADIVPLRVCAPVGEPVSVTVAVGVSLPESVSELEFAVSVSCGVAVLEASHDSVRDADSSPVSVAADLVGDAVDVNVGSSLTVLDRVAVGSQLTVLVGPPLSLSVTVRSGGTVSVCVPEYVTFCDFVLVVSDDTVTDRDSSSESDAVVVVDRDALGSADGLRVTFAVPVPLASRVVVGDAVRLASRVSDWLSVSDPESLRSGLSVALSVTNADADGDTDDVRESSFVTDTETVCVSDGDSLGERLPVSVSDGDRLAVELSDMDAVSVCVDEAVRLDDALRSALYEPVMVGSVE